MYKQQEIDEVIKQAQRGENKAIEYLINQNMDIVYAKARYYFIKGLDKEDVIQEGMVGLYKAIRDYQKEREASFRGFSQLCVHRQLVSAIKKANRQKHMPLNTSTSLDKSINFDDDNGRCFKEILPDNSTHLEQNYIYREMLTIILEDLVEELTKLEWQVFTEYLEDKSYQEISNELNVNLKTVDNALQRARKKIENIKTDYDINNIVS